MSTYRAPLRDMQFALRELAGIDGVAALPGCEDTLDVLDSVLEEAAAFASGVLDPLNRVGDNEGCTWSDGAVTTPAGFKEAYQEIRRGRLDRLAGSGGVRRPRLAAAAARSDARDVERGQHRLRQRTAAQPGRDRGDRARRLRGAEEALHPQSRLGQMDGDDVPDRAAGRLGSRAGAHARRPRRRPLQDLGHEDLHHVRRARHGREHHPPRARALAGRAGGHEGHLALHRAEVPRQRRRQPRRAQRRRVFGHRAQAGHQRQPDLHAELRREAEKAPSATSSASRTAGSSTCSS